MCSVHLKHILVIFRGHLPHHPAILVGGGYPPGTNARRSRCETDLGARFCKVTLANQLKTLVIGPLVNNSTTSLFDPGSCLPRWNLSRAKRLKSCVPRAKSGPLLVFVNKVLSEHIHLFTFCLYLLSSYNGRVEFGTETRWPTRPKRFTI